MNHKLQWLLFAVLAVGLAFIYNNNSSNPAPQAATAQPTATLTATSIPTKTSTPSPSTTPTTKPTEIPTTTSTPQPTPQVDIETAIKASVNCLVHYDQNMLPCLDRAEKLGAKTVVLTTQVWTQDRFSMEVEIDPQVTLSMTNTQVFVNEAHARGLRVVYKPIVNLRDQMAGDSFGWRGNISLSKADQVTWFNSYRDVLSTLLEWSSRADGFIIGTEFSSLQGNDAEWRKVVSLVRSRTPINTFIAYNANWYGLAETKEGVAAVAWWEEVDAIGVSAYFPLCKEMEKEPNIEELVACWQPIKENLLKYAESHSKPLWFAEIGLAAKTGRYALPFDEFHGDPCNECQNNWYKAAIAAWHNTPNFLGLTWWSLTAEPVVENDFGFDPIGKPAELTLRKFFRQYR